MALWTAPLWTACAKWCNKKKGVLGLSLFFLTGSTVMLALVPPASPNLPELFCSRNLNYSTLHLSQLPSWVADHIKGGTTGTTLAPVAGNGSGINQEVLPPGSSGSGGVKVPTDISAPQEKANVTSTSSTASAITTTTGTTPTTTTVVTTQTLESLINDLLHDYDSQHKNVKDKTPVPPLSPPIPPPNQFPSTPNKPISTPNGVQKNKTTGSWPGSSTSGSSNTGSFNTGSSNTGSFSTGTSNTGSFNTGSSHSGSVITGSSNTAAGTTTQDVNKLMKELQDMGMSMDLIQNFLAMSDAQQQQFLKDLGKSTSSGHKSTHSSHSGYQNKKHRRHLSRHLLAVLEPEANTNQTDIQTTFKDTLDYFMKKCTFCTGHATFVFVMALVVIGELFSSPVDKLSDDIWFEYLDVVDALDRYGSHRAWASLGMVVAAPVVTIIVDHLPCVLSEGLSSFNIHFFVFVGFMVFSFVVLCAYPVSTNRRSAKRSKVGKGMKVLCTDSHAMAYTFTVVMVAVCYAPVYYFLMWQMQDLEGSEVVMGVSVAAASFSELLIYPFKGWLITHITHAGAVSISLVVLSFRFVFYSFMWSPWMAVIGEATQGITLSLLWTTIQTYGDFRCNPYVMDRSAYHVINALYAFGLVLGAAVSGILYDTFGMVILLRGCAVAIGVWLVIFLSITMCTKKKEKVRYAALLQDEEDFTSDEDNTIYEDDWLEVALSKTSNKSNKWK